MDVIDQIHYARIDNKDDVKSQQEIQDAYIAVFSTPAGKTILAYMMLKCGYGIIFALDNVNQQYFKTGQQSVITQIKNAFNEIVLPDAEVSDTFD